METGKHLQLANAVVPSENTLGRGRYRLRGSSRSRVHRSAYTRVSDQQQMEQSRILAVISRAVELKTENLRVVDVRNMCSPLNIEITDDNGKKLPKSKLLERIINYYAQHTDEFYSNTALYVRPNLQFTMQTFYQ